MSFPEVVSCDQWLEARLRLLLAEEKEETHRRDALNAERRRLPMVRIEHLFDLRAGQRIHPQPLFNARPDRSGQAGRLGGAQGPPPSRAQHVADTHKLNLPPRLALMIHGDRSLAWDGRCAA
jgi:hypothetical protein